MLTVPPDTQTDWSLIAHQFEAIIGKNGVVRRKEELLVYECDGLTSYRQRPTVVVLPCTTKDVAAIVSSERTGIYRNNYLHNSWHCCWNQYWKREP
ncbi:hypothetical protein [Leptodesmis sp.]|uniref:hypothetical protein n=1 Tax=Leptodesmis sp. TaxID=3100501 RepID=UPI0040534FED